MSVKVNDRVLCTDQFGSYYKEPGTVVGFSTNLLGMKLVEVQLDNNPKGRTSGFYPSEVYLDDED